MRAHDLAFNALAPYDAFSSQKYNAAIVALGEFNWEPCHENVKLSQLLGQDELMWNTFWAAENAKELADANAQKHAEEIDVTIDDLQRAWYYADPHQAGAAFAHFRRLITEVEAVEEKPQEEEPLEEKPQEEKSEEEE